LKTRKEIDAAVGTGGGSGDWGYINTQSGWADAEEGMKWLRRKAEATGRISFVTGQAISLLKSGTKVLGATLKSNTSTPRRHHNTRNRRLDKLACRPTRTRYSYRPSIMLPALSASEQERLGKMPVLAEYEHRDVHHPAQESDPESRKTRVWLLQPDFNTKPFGKWEKIDVSIPTDNSR
jgi:sarcosine oxidase/L-pipecolate oxidase